MKKYSEFLNEIATGAAVIQPKKNVSDFDDVLNSIRSFYKNLTNSIKDIESIEQRDAIVVQNNNKKKSKVSKVIPGTTTTTTTLALGTTTTTTTLAPGTTTTTTTLTT